MAALDGLGSYTFMSGHGSASRRDFIKLSSLAGAGVFAGKALADQNAPLRGGPKNLIFLVVDGMGTGTLALAQAFSERVNGQSLEWFDLYRRGGYTRSFQDTASANSAVTDSAAAGSSWGCGQRVNNGSLNVTVDGARPKPLFLRAKEAGKATGVVSTCRITHATPASFVVNVDDRDSSDAIVDQYLERSLDVYLGGGRKHFRRDGKDLTKLFQDKGYELATDKNALERATSHDKLLGLFSDSHMPYAIDRTFREEHENIPSLEVMFESALKVLGRNPEGFVLQVESGRVDHAGHDNDPAAMLHEMLEFDRCIPIAQKFLAEHPDTLVVLTTDHGTGGCQLNGVGKRYLDTNDALANLADMKGSFETLADRYYEKGEFDGGAFSDMCGVSVSEEEALRVVKLVPEMGGYFSGAVATVFGDKLLKRTGVGFSSDMHTGEQVEFLALGSGQEAFPPFLYNYQVNGILCDLLKI